MSHRDRLLLQSLSLLSQELPKLADPYGPLFKSTSCVNAEEREMIGVLFGLTEIIKDEEDLKEETKYIRDKIIPFVEILGISRWPRTELTDLGIRVGEKHRVKVRLPDMPQEKIEGEEPWKKITEDDIISGKSESDS